MSFGDSYADLYDSFYEKKKYDKEFSNIQQIVKQSGKVFHGKRVLEIGCGSGNFTNLFASVSDVTAIDSSKSMTDRAKRKYPNLSSRILQSSLSDFVKENNNAKSFDFIVLLFHVFSYFNLRDIAILRNSAEKLLSKGGFLIFDYWDLEAVNLNRPTNTIRESEFEGRKYLRVADTKSCKKTDNFEKFEVKFRFYIEEEVERKKFLFSEKHTLYAHDSKRLEEHFQNYECLADWDILEGTPFQLKNYGNTKIFTNDKKKYRIIS